VANIGMTDRLTKSIHGTVSVAAANSVQKAGGAAKP